MRRLISLSLVLGTVVLQVRAAEPPPPDAVATSLMHVPIFNFAVHNVAFSPDGRTLAVRFSPDGKTLASASYDGTVRLWNVAGTAIQILSGHPNRIFSVAFSPDGSRVASAGDSTVRVWDTASAAPLHVFSLGGTVPTANGTVTEHLSAVAFSPEGQTLAVSSTTGATFLLSAETGKVLRKFVAP